MRRFGTRRALIFNPSKPSGLLLPAVGPFADLGNIPVSGLSNIILGQTVDSSRTSPQMGNLVSIGELQTQPVSEGSWAMFIWANKLNTFGAADAFDLAGQQGFGGQDDGYGGPPYIGGNGGFGGSGGGGGASNTSAASQQNGGAGGNAADGFSGQDDGTGFAGLGGTGSAYAYNTGFFYGNGGNGSGSSDPASGSPGTGGNGYGGGGAGQGALSIQEAGGGGGGGGGLFVCVLNEGIEWGSVRIAGGPGGGGNSTYGGNGGTGGDGVAWLAFKKYDGTFVTQDNLGIVTLYEIKSDLSLVQHTDLTDSWDNL